MFYTRAEQTQRTGYWCMFAIPTIHSLEFLPTLVHSPHERLCSHLSGLARFRLHSHQDSGLRTLAMASHHHRHPDFIYLDTLLVLFP